MDTQPDTETLINSFGYKSQLWFPDKQIINIRVPILEVGCIFSMITVPVGLFVCYGVLCSIVLQWRWRFQTLDKESIHYGFTLSYTKLFEHRMTIHWFRGGSLSSHHRAMHLLATVITILHHFLIIIDEGCKI